MAHFPKPFFRKSRKLWYVQLGGKQINLGPDKDTAFHQYHKLLATPVEQPVVSDFSLVVALCDSFLSWTKKHRSEATYNWYRNRLQRFALEYPDLTVADLKPFHVQEWVDDMEIKPTTQRNYIRSIKRAMKWARQQGYIQVDPIAEMPAPSADRREQVFTQEEYQRLLDVIPDKAFKELVVTTWEPGCRPQESRRVEARHFDAANQRWVFPKSESKMKKTARVVYLSDTAAEISKRLVKKYPTGLLFRNAKGQPWKNYAIQCVWRRIRIRIGKDIMKAEGVEVSEVEISKKIKTLKPTKTRAGKESVKTPAELRCEAKRKLTEQMAIRKTPNHCLYVLRHSFATNALLKGVDSLTVSQLLGHSDVSTLAKVYQHLSSNPQHLLDQVNIVTS